MAAYHIPHGIYISIDKTDVWQACEKLKNRRAIAGGHVEKGNHKYTK